MLILIKYIPVLYCMCESNNVSLLPQGQPGPLILDDNFLRVASTGITEEEDDSNGGAIAAGVIVPLLVITAAVVGVIIFIWYYR